MEWHERRKRREKSEQFNMRVCIIDQQNIDLVMAHLNANRPAWNPATKTDVILESIHAYLKKHKIKPVTE